MDKLKPCPFCGSPDVDAEGWSKWWNGEWITGPACNACGGAAGSISQSPADNRAAWNTRTDSALADLTVRAEQAEATLARLNAPINLAEVRAIYGDNYVDTDDDAVMAHVGFAEIIRMARLAAPENRKWSNQNHRWEYEAQGLLEPEKLADGQDGPEDQAQTIAALTQEVATLKAERDTALMANELDRRTLFSIVRAIDEEITGRMWLLEGRGSYEWDDDRYRQEFGWAVHALQEKLEPLRKIAGDLKNCPATEVGVNSVRKLEAALATLRSELQKANEPKACPDCGRYPGERAIQIGDTSDDKSEGE